ncbi:MAG: Zn-dependent hydrolase [Kyrpidia tusciae]|nr:Zn-dependent hydrolase [Kyrpidia tusciae]MBE3552632.1 Zn-dependent hydrolase [Kyrpidia tusciae]
MGTSAAGFDVQGVNSGRIAQRLEELARFGRSEASGGGWFRGFGTEAELRAREWLRDLWHKALGLEVRVDPAANLWGTLPGRETLPALVLGSHHDTVPNGGQFDGALGLVLATEVVQRLVEVGCRLRHPVQVVSFTAEEPNPFQVSTLGSRAAAGVLRGVDVRGAVHIRTGVSLRDALQAAGGDLDRLNRARLDPASVSAYLECHIEQGKRLWSRGIPLGVVTGITGIYREEVVVEGEANHAGTTLMADRRDALCAAAELVLGFEEAVVRGGGEEIVGTIGQLEVKPNAPNIVPGCVSLILEVRSPDREGTAKVLTAFDECVRRVEAGRRVQVRRVRLLDQEASRMDPAVIGALERAAAGLGEPYMLLSSMAGHDATHMARITRAGMLFVPSVGGKSHCPEEESRMEDIAKAGDALLRALLILDEELDAR